MADKNLNKKLLAEMFDALMQNDTEKAKRLFKRQWDLNAKNQFSLMESTDEEFEVNGIDDEVSAEITDEVGADKEERFNQVQVAIDELEEKFPGEMTDEISEKFDDLRNTIDELKLSDDEDVDTEEANIILDDIRNDFEVAGDIDEDIEALFDEISGGIAGEDVEEEIDVDVDVDEDDDEVDVDVDEEITESKKCPKCKKQPCVCEEDEFDDDMITESDDIDLKFESKDEDLDFDDDEDKDDKDLDLDDDEDDEDFDEDKDDEDLDFDDDEDEDEDDEIEDEEEDVEKIYDIKDDLKDLIKKLDSLAEDEKDEMDECWTKQKLPRNKLRSEEEGVNKKAMKMGEEAKFAKPELKMSNPPKPGKSAYVKPKVQAYDNKGTKSWTKVAKPSNNAAKARSAMDTRG